MPTSFSLAVLLRRASRATLGLLAFALVSCEDSASPSLILSTLSVTLDAGQVTAGASTVARATGVDQFGDPIETGVVVWNSSNTAIASVDAAGAITSVAPGSVQIVATVGSVTGTALLTVAPQPPVLTSLEVNVSPTVITFGQTVTATVRGVDQFGGTIAAGAVQWSTSAPAVASVSGAGVITGVSAGSAQITASAGSLTSIATVSVNAPAAIVINEVESNQGVPGDWVELFNPTSAPVDISGWALKDDDDSRAFRFAAGTVIPPGGYLVAEEAQFGFGLGSADAARLFNPFGVLVTSYNWTAHATTTYGRCPNGTGPFITMQTVTKGAANDCRPQIRVNEVESNGGTPGDWIELYNVGTTTVDLSGFLVKDNDDSRTTRLPAGSTIAPGGFFVIEESTLGFGLGAADAARIYTEAGVLIDSYAWTAHATTTYARCPDGTGGFATATSSTKGAANDCSAAIKINEVESNGGTPGDWIELYNAGGTAVDLSGYIIKDNDDSRTSAIPAGTTLAPGAFLVLEESFFGFGLGGADAARLFTPTGALVDAYEWTTHAAITYGRCPDGTGAFASTTASTKGAANICGTTGPSNAPWPGSNDVVTVDVANTFGTNMSGLTFEPAGGGAPAVLWASKNGPGTLYRLIQSGANWVPDPANGWASGKALRYPDNSGDVDAEGVAFAGGSSAGGMYIAAERNNSASSASRNSILRYDASQAGSTLTATHEWNLTADLPVVGANAGAEAITWIPDSVLVNRGFFDESKGRAYAPADYPNHAGGIFFVGLEANGIIYAYALNHSNTSFTRVATITTGYPGVMGLEYDPETRYLWATCDDGCGNVAGFMVIDTGAASATRGRFTTPQRHARPTGLGNFNHEGFALAPQSACVAGVKPVFWADDNQTAGNALRRGGISCGPIAPATSSASGSSRFWR